ncbi:uncharacterized protein [Dysidea avara]|uniref:uncharacterized protein isoform X2 n=1 Tax=Dysidea avara TaxID=196820 RepID=UPI0033306A4B
MAEAYHGALTQIHDRLATALVNYVDDIEKQLIEKEVLSKYQAECSRKQENSKLKLQYILKDCILYQLKTNKDTQFQVLMEYMRSASKIDQNLVPLVEYIDSEEKSVPVNPSQQETDDGSLSQQGLGCIESGSSGIGFSPLSASVVAEPKQAVAKAKTELVMSRPLSPHGRVKPAILKLNSVLQKASESNVALCVRFSIVLFTGLPKTERTSVVRLVMKRNHRSSETILIKKKFIPTNTTNNWEEVTISDLYSFINATTKLECTDTKDIWNILILLDIDIPPLTAYGPYILPRALFTCVVDDFCDLKKSFEEYEQHKDDSSLPCFDNLYLCKNVISANCLKESSRSNRLFEKLKVQRGDSYIYTAFIGTYQGKKPTDTATIDNGLIHMLDDINCPSEKDPLSLLHLGNCKLIFSVNNAKKSDEIANRLFLQMDRRLLQQTVYKIPFLWLFLLLEIKQMCNARPFKYISFAEILENIWKQKFNNGDGTELHAALKLFNSIGVILYIESNSTSDGYIFCEWNWLLKALNCFMKRSIPDDIDTTYTAHNLFVYEGILNQRMLSDISPLFEVEMNVLMQLLVHFRLAIPLCRNTAQTTEHFISHRLPIIEKCHEILSKYGDLQLAPLMMTYSSGTLHPSLFCKFAGYLLENKPDDWSKPLESSEKRQYTFGNLITFPVGGGYSVSLCDKVFYLEIQIRKQSDCKNGANVTLRSITAALVKAYSSLKAKKSNIIWGYQCAICKHDHMMILSKECANHAYCSKKKQKFYLTGEWYAAWLYPSLKKAVSGSSSEYASSFPASDDSLVPDSGSLSHSTSESIPSTPHSVQIEAYYSGIRCQFSLSSSSTASFTESISAQSIHHESSSVTTYVPMTTDTIQYTTVPPASAGNYSLKQQTSTCHCETIEFASVHGYSNLIVGTTINTGQL